MGAPIDDLIAFIKKRQMELGISQNLLARRSGMRPGTLANLMIGRVTKSPSLETLEKLAGGMGVDADVLIRLARGATAPARRADALDAGKPAQLAGPQQHEGAGSQAYPLTTEERHVMALAESQGLHWQVERDHEILAMPPAQRKWIFRDLESLLHTMQIHKNIRRLTLPD